MLAPRKPRSTGHPADFRHVETWVFDLDNTLYRASSDIFAQIDARMTAYIAETYAMEPAEADRLRRHYYATYGTTLSGLMASHGADPERFLAYVHDIDLSMLAPNAALIAAVERLPGRRLVFTNGCVHHARRVLERLGLAQAMERVWDIRAMGFVPKPRPEAYARLVEDLAFAPAAAAMFEDMAKNLEPAAALGMTTVWLNNGSRWSSQGPDDPPPDRSHIDHEIDDLAEFLHAVKL